MDQSQEVEINGRRVTIYPTGDPKRIRVRTKDLGIKNYTGKHFYCTRPYLSEQDLALMSKNKSKSTTVLHGFAKCLQAKTGTKRKEGTVLYSNETLVSSNPDPCLRYVPMPYQSASALPPPMTREESLAKAAAIKANLAASIAAIKARSAKAIAAAPAITHYWEDPSKEKASEAAASSEQTML